MKKAVNILELFSGIGGFSRGLMEAGFSFNKHYYLKHYIRHGI